MRTVSLFSVGIGVVLLLSACSAQTSTTPSPSPVADMSQERVGASVSPMTSAQTSAQPSTSAAVEAAETQASPVKAFTLEAGSFYYKPNEIKVKKGDKVKVTINSVSMVHDFNIDELNVHSPMTKNGESNTVEFTADKVGVFEFYCSVGQHRKNGQVGKITVE